MCEHFLFISLYEKAFYMPHTGGVREGEAGRGPMELVEESGYENTFYLMLYKRAHSICHNTNTGVFVGQ